MARLEQNRIKRVSAVLEEGIGGTVRSEQFCEPVAARIASAGRQSEGAWVGPSNTAQGGALALTPRSQAATFTLHNNVTNTLCPRYPTHPTPQHRVTTPVQYDAPDPFLTYLFINPRHFVSQENQNLQQGVMPEYFM